MLLSIEKRYNRPGFFCIILYDDDKRAAYRGFMKAHSGELMPPGASNVVMDANLFNSTRWAIKDVFKKYPHAKRLRRDEKSRRLVYLPDSIIREYIV